ncbi:MAG: hypothetical protein Q9227_004835 [Pyrenula ochraceoflavens]
MSVENFLSSYFNGSVVSDPSKGDNYPYIVTASGIQLEKFYNSGNMSFDYVDGLFKNVADSMTAYIRQSTKPGAGGFTPLNEKEMEASGTAYKQDTCIVVRWRFLALPIILVALTAFFLIAIIAETISIDRRPWKSSSLALLFSGLDSESRRREADSLEQIEQEAQAMKVRLRRTDEGWKFVEN